MARVKEIRGTEERILDSAEALFAQGGFHGTSTRQIAAKAGISIQTLHYHCGSKLNLYNRILERSVVPVTVMLNDHIQKMLERDLNDDGVLKESIDRLIDELFDVLHENPNFPLLFFRQWLEQDPELRKVEWERLVPYLRQWARQVESLVDEDRRRGIDLPLTFISLSMVFWGLFSNPTFMGNFLNMEFDSPEYVERLKTHAREMTARVLSSGGDYRPSGRKIKK